MLRPAGVLLRDPSPGRPAPAGGRPAAPRTGALFLFSVLLAGPPSLAAQEEDSLAAFLGQPTLVIENGRVWLGGGAPLERASVTIIGDRIEDVTTEPVPTPRARRIDAAGATVLPGLVDANVHLLGAPKSEEELRTYIEEELADVLTGFLERGVTTVVSTGDPWPWIREVRERIAGGDLPGPRLVVAGPALTAPGGHPAATACRGSPFCREHLARELAGPDEARNAVRRLAEEDVDAIMAVVDDVADAAGEPLPAMPFEVLEAVLREARDHELPVLGHIGEATVAARAVRMGLDGLLLPPVRGTAEEREELVSVLLQEDVPVITAAAGLDRYTDAGGAERTFRGEEYGPEAALSLERLLDFITELAAAGIRVVPGSGWTPRGAVSSDPRAGPGTMTLNELRLLVEAGLSPRRVLRAATRDAAVVIGLDGVIGTLEPGQAADLIVVEGNPLADIGDLSRVRFVVKEGELVVGAGGRP